MAAPETQVPGTRSPPHDRLPHRHRIAGNAAVVESCLAVKPPWNTVRTGRQRNARPLFREPSPLFLGCVSLRSQEVQLQRMSRAVTVRTKMNPGFMAVRYDFETWN